jgi:hypothetical protein
MPAKANEKINEPAKGPNHGTKLPIMKPKGR